MSKSPYVTHATQRLQDALREFSDTESERMSLSAEIDLARLLTTQAVKLFDQAHYGDKKDEIKEELKIASRAALMDNLKHVMDLVDRAAKVMVLTRGMYTPQQVQQTMTMVTRIIERYVTDPEKLKAICKELDEIRITEERDKATTVIQIT